MVHRLRARWLSRPWTIPDTDRLTTPVRQRQVLSPRRLHAGGGPFGAFKARDYLVHLAQTAPSIERNSDLGDRGDPRGSRLEAHSRQGRLPSRSATGRHGLRLTSPPVLKPVLGSCHADRCAGRTGPARALRLLGHPVSPRGRTAVPNSRDRLHRRAVHPIVPPWIRTLRIPAAARSGQSDGAHPIAAGDGWAGNRRIDTGNESIMKG